MIQLTVEHLWNQLWALWRSKQAPADHEIQKWTNYLAEGLSKGLPDVIDGKLVMPYGDPWNIKPAGFRGEYLVDLVWSIDGDPKDWSKYEGLVLAMETELSDSSDEGRWYDFAKLSDIRADIRIFVGAFPKASSAENMKQWIEKVRTFLEGHRHRMPGDHYLIALYFKENDQRDKQRPLHGWRIEIDSSKNATVEGPWTSRLGKRPV